MKLALQVVVLVVVAGILYNKVVGPAIAKV